MAQKLCVCLCFQISSSPLKAEVKKSITDMIDCSPHKEKEPVTTPLTARVASSKHK